MCVCVGEGEKVSILQLTCDLQVVLCIVWPYLSFQFHVFFVDALLLSKLVVIVFEGNWTHGLRERRFPSTKLRLLPQPTLLFCGLEGHFFFFQVPCADMPLFKFKRKFYLLYSDSSFSKFKPDIITNQYKWSPVLHGTEPL